MLDSERVGVSCGVARISTGADMAFGVATVGTLATLLGVVVGSWGRAGVPDGAFGSAGMFEAPVTAAAPGSEGSPAVPDAGVERGSVGRAAVPESGVAPGSVGRAADAAAGVPE